MFCETADACAAAASIAVRAAERAPVRVRDSMTASDREVQGDAGGLAEPGEHADDPLARLRETAEEGQIRVDEGERFLGRRTVGGAGCRGGADLRDELLK